MAPTPARNAMREEGGSVGVRLEERAGGLVARVIIDNQAKLNTLSSSLMNRLAEALRGLAANEQLRAVVLTGAGERAFVGGADIEEMAKLTPETARAFITRIHECCEALRRLPVPVLARINGFALGAGMEIAAACDLRLASENARFGMPEVKLGIPSVVEAALLPMLIGWGRTRQILLLGEIFTAEEARAWGFVERVVPDGELDAAVEEWLEALLACGPRAISLQKRLILDWEELVPSAAVDAGIEAFVEAWRSPEPKLAMESFLAAKVARKRGGGAGRA
jgi:enoyl-CoA hydratase